MKSILLLIVILLTTTTTLFGQFCPYLGPNQALPCGVNSTTLTADLSQCGPGGVNPNQTTNYGVTNIPYVAQTNTGTQLFMTDDSQQGPFNTKIPALVVNPVDLALDLTFVSLDKHTLSFMLVLMVGFHFLEDNQQHSHLLLYQLETL